MLQIDDWLKITVDSYSLEDRPSKCKLDGRLEVIFSLCDCIIFLYNAIVYDFIPSLVTRHISVRRSISPSSNIEVSTSFPNNKFLYIFVMTEHRVTPT